VSLSTSKVEPTIGSTALALSRAASLQSSACMIIVQLNR